MAATNDPSFTRRTGLASAGAGAGAAALGGKSALAQTGQPKTFVLVHGAWHGGWGWRRVADLLEKQGHKVFTPTLTGVGERSHLLSKDINLDTHITDLVNVFKWEDLKDVCLVVHSYGGWPGSGALEQIGDRVASIVWLDAFKPESGQRGADYPPGAFRSDTIEGIASALLKYRTLSGRAIDALLPEIPAPAAALLELQFRPPRLSE